MMEIRHYGRGAQWSFLLVLAACAGSNHAVRDGCDRAPKPGLYEVVARECENPLQETDYCPLTQYIEIAPSEMYGVPGGPYSLAFWYAEQRQSSEYSYQADVLHGRCLSAERYVLERGAESEASLTLREGVPLEYNFLGYTEPPNRRLLFRMRLTLQPVLRSPELDRRLHVERE